MPENSQKYSYTAHANLSGFLKKMLNHAISTGLRAKKFLISAQIITKFKSFSVQTTKIHLTWEKKIRTPPAAEISPPELQLAMWIRCTGWNNTRIAIIDHASSIVIENASQKRFFFCLEWCVVHPVDKDDLYLKFQVALMKSWSSSTFTNELNIAPRCTRCSELISD